MSMNLRPTLPLMALCVCATVASLPAQDSPGAGRDQQLQAAFLQFPFVTQATNSQGQPEFQKLDSMDPVVIEGAHYYGFRFKVPRRENAEDFVWATIPAPNLIAWYILPEKGEMDGFENFRLMPKANYLSTGTLPPVNQRRLMVQSLAGDSLKDQETYLIWWTLRGRPRQVFVSFAFAPLGPNGLNQVGPMEKALALVRASGIPSSNSDAESPQPSQPGQGSAKRPHPVQRSQPPAHSFGGLLVAAELAAFAGGVLWLIFHKRTS